MKKSQQKKEGIGVGVYLDHASTTAVDSRVLKAMTPYFSDVFWNPSSLYRGGLEAKKAIEDSRQTVAKFLNCKSREVFFTSGGTESDNLAILGVARSYKKGHIITSAFEHPAVLNTCRELEKDGFKVTYIKPSRDGFIKATDVKAVLQKNTILVSIMSANNEIGTIQPIAEISEVIRDFRSSKLKAQSSNETRRSNNNNPEDLDFGFLASDLTTYPLFHTDACQATGYLDMDVSKLGVDLLTINGSKIYGPKGVGALYVKEGTTIEPIAIGGGQERGLRPGTENTPSIVGLAKAIEIIDRKSITKESSLRDFMIDELLKIKDSQLNGSRSNRLPNNVNISFDGAEGESAVLYLDRKGIACSTGSACSSQSLEPSHVLLAIGQTTERAHCSLRFTLGRKNTKIEIRRAVKEIIKVINLIRKMSATYAK